MVAAVASNRALAGEATRSAGSERTENAAPVAGVDAKTGTHARTGRRTITEADVENEALQDVLGDEYTREVLGALSDEACGAAELVDRLEMSRATVYRRLDRLQELGLLTAHVAIDADGNQFKLFETTVAQVTVELAGGTPEVHVETRDASSEYERPPTPASAD